MESINFQNLNYDESNRHILGTYFNMAFENFKRTMRVLCENKLKLSINDYGMPNGELLTADQSLQLRKALFRHLPFLAPIMDAWVGKQLSDDNDNENTISQKQKTAKLDCSIIEILSHLNIFAQELSYCRNKYTHANAYNLEKEDIEHSKREEEIAKMLEVLMKAERELLKNRKNSDMKSNAMKVFFCDGDKYYYKKENNKSVRNKQFHFNPAFINNNTTKLTNFGRIYFCSLFLRSRDAERFATEMKIFIESPWPDKKDEGSNPPTYSPSDENKVVRDVMQMHRIHIPREKRIDAVPTKGTLLMDMLEELRRCPKVLYDTFSPKDKATFNHTVIQDDGTKTNTLMVRYQDRFSQLALRYIDQNELFKNIRFQLRLGLFRFRFYDRTLIDGTPCVRTVHKELNGYGRWQVVEEKRVLLWGDRFQKIDIKEENGYEIEQLQPDTPNTDPYVTDWRATYNIHAGRIGMSWGAVCVKNEREKGSPLLLLDNDYYIPNLPTFKGNDGHNKDRKVSIPQDAPLCTLSTYDLPALLFYQYLINTYGRGIDGEKAPLTESIILEKYYALKKLFEAAKDEACTPESLSTKKEELGLNDSEIPQKLLSYINGKERNPEEDRKKHVKHVLKDMISDIDGRLDSFSKKEERIKEGGRKNRYGNPHHADIRHGSLARYLMRSMLRWQPIDTNADVKQHYGKLTSIDARTLMATLASFDTNDKKSLIDSVFQKAGMIGGNNPHPFVKSLMENSHNIEQLYVAYLKAEKKHANSILLNIDEVILSTLPSFLRTSDKHQHWGIDMEEPRTYINQYAAKLSELPIQLPDSLFTRYIVEFLKKKFDNIPSGNASHLIGWYFKEVQKDESQKFYNSDKYKRFYEDVSKLNPRRKKNKALTPDYYTANEIRGEIKSARKSIKGKCDKKSIALRDKLNQVKEKEKRIRRHRVEDIVLFLSAKQMLISTVGRSFREDEANPQNLNESSPNLTQMQQKAKQFKLEPFGFCEDFHFLSEGDNEEQRKEKDMSDSLFNYTYPYRIKGKQDENGNIATIIIEQKGLSLKNYGNIYSILGDNRLKSLMEGLFDIGIRKVTFGDITAEFASFDALRSTILQLLQKNIEQIAFDTNRGILSDPMDRKFYSVKDRNGNQMEIKIIDPLTKELIAPSKAAIRNQFPELIAMLEEYNDVKDDINELRKAVAHNHYPKNISKLNPTNNRKLDLPNIAHLANEDVKKKICNAQNKNRKQ